jgi:hypothetical protein
VIAENIFNCYMYSNYRSVSRHLSVSSLSGISIICTQDNLVVWPERPRGGGGAVARPRRPRPLPADFSASYKFTKVAFDSLYWNTI